MTVRAFLRLTFVAGLGLSMTAQAALHDRGSGLIYDDVLDLTWLQDANYAQTSGYDADGGMSWNSAVAWATSLSYYDSVRNVAYTGWRLPTVTPIDGVAFDSRFRNIGTSDAGFNISAPGTLYEGSTASEMAYMYYQNLGNPGLYTPDGTENFCSSGCIQNTGPFLNLKTDKYYWTGVEYDLDTSQAWVFGMNTGIQGAGYKEHPNNSFYAWAVRDGDVASVPEADTWATLLVGLGLVGMAVGRRARPRAPRNTALARLKLKALLIAALAATAPALANASYTFTTFDNLGGVYGAAYSVNTSGQLAGLSFTSDSGGHASLWSSGSVIDLGTIGGNSSIAWAINDAEQVVGSSYTASGGQHATLWSGSTVTDLGTLGGPRSQALGINNSGQIVGISQINAYSGNYFAVLWDGAAMVNLGALAGGSPSFAYAINDSGTITGWREDSTGQRATIWNGTAVTDLGTFGSGVDINSFDAVAGFRLLNGYSERRATVWEGGDVIDLGTLGGESVARAINDSGTVVGWSRLEPGVTHGFLWNGIEMIDLNTLLDEGSASAGWVLNDATDINANGWITGIASNPLTGQTQAFLLTPVPEPETYAMLLAGLGLVGMAVRRRRG